MRIVTGIGQTGGHQNAYQAGPAGQEQQAAGAQERLKDLLRGGVRRRRRGKTESLAAGRSGRAACGRAGQRAVAV